MPVDFLCQIAGDHRSEKSAEIDSHVENGKAGVAPLIAFLVQRADHSADIWLEQASADHNQREACIEEGQSSEREREVSSRDDGTANEHAVILSQAPIGNDSTNNCCRPCATGIRAVDRSGALDRKLQSAGHDWSGHVQDEESAHAVVTKAFPHFGEKQRAQPSWMMDLFGHVDRRYHT